MSESLAEGGDGDSLVGGFFKGREGDVVVGGDGEVLGIVLVSPAKHKYLSPTNPSLWSSVCQGPPSPEASEQINFKFLCRRLRTDDGLNSGSE